jgi:hypothetical protein
VGFSPFPPPQRFQAFCPPWLKTSSMLKNPFVEDEVLKAVTHWWLWRYAQVMQQVVGSDKCPTLLKIFSEAFTFIKKSSIISEPGTKLLFLIEAAHTTLEFYQYDAAVTCINEFQAFYGKKFSHSGALGKRTRFQQDNIAQLYLKVENEEAKKLEKSKFDCVRKNGNKVIDVALEDEAVMR